MNSSAADPRPLEPPAVNRILVVGYGNTLRGDDAFGPVVADRLREAVVSDRVVVLTRHQLTPELASDVAACERVVFIDASVEGPAGQVNCRSISKELSGAGHLVHTLDPARLLALAHLVYGRLPSAFLITVGGMDFDLGERRLSPPVAAAVEPALQRVRELIDQ
jgi:hydrogenase maturation protease